MASQTPFLLADNLYDRINLYPLATLSVTLAAIAGREVNYVADYRRERTFYQAASAGAASQIVTDLGAGNTATVDTVWIDRGHNLWGKTVNVSADDGAGGSVITSLSRVVPAQGTVGGDPTTTWCVTEEGAIYALFPLTAARRRFWLVVVESTAPLITGIMLGQRLQMLNYSSVLDEDEGERDVRQENSLVKGYYGRDRVYTGRVCRIQLATIGVSEYDTLIRSMRRLLFERDQPVFVVMNYGTKPERGWLYQYDDTKFSAPAERVYRRTAMRFAECGPLIR